MQLCLRELNCWNDEIIDAYKKEFILPLDTEINKGLFIEIEVSDIEDWDTVDAIMDLCSSSRLALVMVDVSNFRHISAARAPYAICEPDPDFLIKEGRYVLNHFRKELIKHHYTELNILEPDICYFAMCQHGLVY